MLLMYLQARLVPATNSRCDCDPIELAAPLREAGLPAQAESRQSHPGKTEVKTQPRCANFLQLSN